MPDLPFPWVDRSQPIHAYQGADKRWCVLCSDVINPDDYRIDIPTTVSHMCTPCAGYVGFTLDYQHST